MGVMVIVAYRPRPGKAELLLDLTREHVPILRAQGLATDRPAYAMRAADGTITTFDVPQAAGTIPAGSNPSGATTGQYFDSNFVSHGFVRKP